MSTIITTIGVWCLISAFITEAIAMAVAIKGKVAPITHVYIALYLLTAVMAFK